MANNLKLELLLQAVDKVTGPLRRISDGSGAAATAIRASRDQLQGLSTAQRELAKFNGLVRKTEQTSDALKENQRKIEGLNASVQAGTLTQQQAARQRDVLIRRARALKEAYRNESQALEHSRRAMHEGGLVARELIDQMSRGDNVTEAFARAQRQLERQTLAANRAIERQKERLRQLEQVQRRARDAASAGGRAGANITQTATRVGVVGGLTGAAMGGLGHSFAEEAEAAGQWAARLGMTTRELTRLQYAGSQYGVQNDAMIDGLKELSLRTDEFTQTGKGSGAEAFERLGLDAYALEEASRNTTELFNLVMSKLKDVKNVAARQRIVDEIFGGQGGEQMAEMVSASTAEIQRLKKEADTIGASFNEKDVDAARDYMRAWRGVTGSLKGVRNVLGRELAPVLEKLFTQFSTWVAGNRDQIQKFADELGYGLRAAVPVFRDLAKGAWTFIKAVAGTIQTVSALVGGVENFAIIAGIAFAGKTLASIGIFAGSVLKLGWSFLQLVGVAPYLITGIKAIGAAFMATPIGWIIAGITAVATAAYLIWEYWEPIKAFMAGLWSGVLGVLSSVWNGIKALFSWTPLGMIIENWGALTEWFTGLGDGIMAGLGKALDWITNKFLAPIKAIKEMVGGAWDSLFGGDDEATDKIKKAAQLARNAVGAAAIGTSAAVYPAAADIAFDNRPPVSSGAAARNTLAGDQVTFNIYAVPGMDESAIARQIEIVLARRDREKASRRRSALYDQE